MELKRTLSTWLTFAYGLGTLLGAGIYVLVGKVAAFATLFTPLAFLIASIVAAFTAFSYAKLCALYPKAAGEATYVQHAFGKKGLTIAVGWMVIVTGVVSAAAMTQGFVGYFQVFFPLPSWLIIVSVTAILGLLTIWGVSQSVITSAIITLIEVIGLVWIIVLSGFQVVKSPELPFKWVSPDLEIWVGIGMGAFLAFYAYIGFEDMVNLAEEVKNPQKNLPRAIFWVIITATILYVLVSLSAVLAIPIDELGTTSAPFALLFEKQGMSPTLISLISLIAIINGILVQIIMASRVLYGMGKQQAAPRLFSSVHPRTQTPIWATLFTTALLLLLALWLPIVVLAQITSFIILIVFALINLSLIILKKKRALPYKISPGIIGFLLCLGLLVGRIMLLFVI